MKFLEGMCNDVESVVELLNRQFLRNNLKFVPHSEYISTLKEELHEKLQEAIRLSKTDNLEIFSTLQSLEVYLDTYTATYKLLGIYEGFCDAIISTKLGE